jgi:hypothetical protein
MPDQSGTQEAKLLNIFTSSDSQSMGVVRAFRLSSNPVRHQIPDLRYAFIPFPPTPSPTLPSFFCIVEPAGRVCPARLAAHACRGSQAGASQLSEYVAARYDFFFLFLCVRPK